MMIQNATLGCNDDHASDLTIELATNCWNAILANESEQHKCFGKEKNYSGNYAREVHFASLKSWIFQRELTPKALRSWSVEVDDDDNNNSGNVETGIKKSVTRFTSEKDVFVYLNTVEKIVVEQLREGQYLVINRMDNHPFLLLEERSNFWCNLLCYPAHPMFFKFFNPSRAFRVPATEGSCCGKEAKKESIYFRARNNTVLMTFEKSGICSNCSQCNFLVPWCPNCLVLGDCCQSETWMHAGDIPMESTEVSCCMPTKKPPFFATINGTSYKSMKGPPGNCDKTEMFGHSKVPLLGGIFTPTVNLMSRNSGESISFKDSEEITFGVLKGPTCFGGCLGLCCNATFKATSTAPAPDSTNPKGSVPLPISDSGSKEATSIKIAVQKGQSLGKITKLKGGRGLEFRYVQAFGKEINFRDQFFLFPFPAFELLLRFNS